MEPIDHLDELLKTALKSAPLPHPGSNFSYNVMQKLEKNRAATAYDKPLISKNTLALIFMLAPFLIALAFLFLPDQKEKGFLDLQSIVPPELIHEKLNQIFQNISFSPYLLPVLLAILMQLFFVKKLLEKH